MNAYLVSAGFRELVVEYIDDYARTEPAFLVDVVFAATRGQARSIFAKHHQRHYVEFTDIKRVKLIEPVDRDRGIASSSDEVWTHIPDDTWSVV